MAGHSKFKNIMHRKGAQDKKRAKLFTKLIREIFTAVRTGQPDPDFNPRLRLAISNAKVLNLPKDRIDNAIKKGSTIGEGDNYDEIRYEGYAPGGVALIVEALTDNRNRTASEVRAAFTKFGGNLGETGSVNFMFDRLGIIEYDKNSASDEEILEISIELGANDCESDESFHHIICNPEDLHLIRENLAKRLGEPSEARLSWQAQNLIHIDDLEQAEKLLKLIDMIEDSDDVQNVYGNYAFSEEVMTKL